MAGWTQPCAQPGRAACRIYESEIRAPASRDSNAPVAVSHACSARTMSGGCGGAKLRMGDAWNDARGPMPSSSQYLVAGFKINVAGLRVKVVGSRALHGRALRRACLGGWTAPPSQPLQRPLFAMQLAACAAARRRAPPPRPGRSPVAALHQRRVGVDAREPHFAALDVCEVVVSAKREVRAAAAAVQQPNCACALAALAAAGAGARALGEQLLELAGVDQELHKLVDLRELVLELDLKMYTVRW